MTAKKRLILALACGVVGALCAGGFLWGQAQSLDRTRQDLVKQFDGDAVKVLVARRRIEAGTLLHERLFDEQLWPEPFVPEGTIGVEDIGAALGHRTTATILAGEALTAFRVFDEQLALDRLSAGMTAVTIPTDAVHALGGELLCGMHVTLMGTLSDGRVEPIAVDVEVLSAGDSADIRWITLALPDGQVGQVLAAAQARTMHVVLPKASLGPSFESVFGEPAEGAAEGVAEGFAGGAVGRTAGEAAEGAADF